MGIVGIMGGKVYVVISIIILCSVIIAILSGDKK